MVKILIIQQKPTTNKTKQAELMVSAIITAEGLQRRRCFQKRINGNMVNKQASLVYNCSFANEENCAPLARPIQLWQPIGLRQRFEIRWAPHSTVGQPLIEVSNHPRLFVRLIVRYQLPYLGYLPRAVSFKSLFRIHQHVVLDSGYVSSGMLTHCG